MASRDLVPDAGFTEIADRIWVARHAWCDVNVTVVAGDRGLLVVDTLGSERAARAMLADLGRVSSAPVVAVLNTHAHFDHTFGNATLQDRWPEAARYAQEDAAAETLTAGSLVREQATARAAEGTDPHAEEVAESRLLAADRTFSSALVIDLGDRIVEAVHPGRGHTAGDVALRIADADVVLAGDLVEESAPPAYGDDSYPLEWPGTLDLVVGMLTPGTVIVPGHGALVDQAFVQDQRADITVVAETIRDLAGRGVPVDSALEAGSWPFPKAALRDAVRRGYAQLPPGGRSLPLA